MSTVSIGGGGSGVGAAVIFSTAAYFCVFECYLQILSFCFSSSLIGSNLFGFFHCADHVSTITLWVCTSLLATLFSKHDCHEH